MHKVLRALFRDRWPALTDDDLDRASGQVVRLTALLGEKYGYAAPRAERELIQFLDDSMRAIEQGPARTARADRAARSGPRIGRAGDIGALSVGG